MSTHTESARSVAQELANHAHALAALWPRLLEAAGHPAAQRVGTIGRVSNTHVLPGGTTVHTLRREARDTAWTLVELATDAAQLAAPITSDTVPANLHRVAVHAHALATATGPGGPQDVPACPVHREDHPDVADHLGCLTQRVRTAVEPPGARAFVGPCPVLVIPDPPTTCGLDLRAHDGEAATCAGGHTVDTPTAAAQALQQAARRLLTLTQVSALSARLWERHVSPRALETMVRDGRLPTTRGELGEHLVQVRDVAPLVQAMRRPRTPRGG